MNSQNKLLANGLLILSIAILIVFYWSTQDAVSLNDGHPYDAQSYHNMAEQVSLGKPISEISPFAYRFALPYIVGKLSPGDLDTGFKIVNIAFGLLTIGVLYIYIGRFVTSSTIVLFSILLYVINPNSPFRFSHFISAYTDPPALFFILLLLLLSSVVQRMNFKWLVIVSSVGVVGMLFREIVLCGVLVFSFTQCAKLKLSAPFIEFSKIRTQYLGLLALLPPLVALIMTHSFVDGVGGYRISNQIIAVLGYLAEEPGGYLLSWLTAFGCVPIVIALLCSKSMLKFLDRNQSIVIFFMGSAVLPLVSGFHTDRIVYWSYPAILVLFAYVLENHPIRYARWPMKLGFFAPLVMAQILAFRVWLPIPDDPLGELAYPGLPEYFLFTPFGEATLGHTYASTMLTATRIEMAAQYLILAIISGITIYLFNRSIRTAK